MHWIILLSIVLPLLAHNDFTSDVKLTYGSVFKLINPATNLIVHSHDIFFGRGGVMSVTGYHIDDLGSYWQINEQHKSFSKVYSDGVKCGDAVTVSSVIIDYFLRVEQTQFGLTTELLPMVHGKKRDGLDEKINWRITCVDKHDGDQINYTDRIRLKHQVSGKYASLDPAYAYTEANCGRGCSIAGQIQLHALDSADDTTTIFQLQTGITFDRDYVSKE